MNVHGRDCTITLKTQYREAPLPYAEETIREAVSLLREHPPIEGNGSCTAIRLPAGVTGCVVTPLTIGTAPLLLYLAFGSAGLPLFVSETREIYRHHIDLVPLEGGASFDLVQDRGGERRLFEGCRVKGFQLRCYRGETVHLKLDVYGETAPVVYPYSRIAATERGERFSGDFVAYRINGSAHQTIYGLTLSAKRKGGTKTELRIQRVLQRGGDLPGSIEELTITAQLRFDTYEYRHFGTFRITLTRLVLVSDETAIDCADGVTGPLRYYVAGTVSCEVFTSTGEAIA